MIGAAVRGETRREKKEQIKRCREEGAWLGEEAKEGYRREELKREKQMPSRNMEMPHFVLKFLERGT